MTPAADSPPALLREPPSALVEAACLNAEAAAAVSAFFHEGQSANTARTYKTALQYWGAWHALRYGRALSAPVAANVVVQFIVDHLEHDPNRAAPAVTPYSRTADTTQHLLPAAIDRLLVERHYKAKMGPWSFATVETRLAALSKAHEIYRMDNPHLGLGPGSNPLRDPKVRALLTAARRAYARRGRAPSRPVAATRPVMQALLATCGEDLLGVRDRALLLFGWASGGRRRSEITAATFENVRRDGEGFVYELQISKTNQTGSNDPKRFKPIQGAAAHALHAWYRTLLAQGITTGQDLSGHPPRPHCGGPACRCGARHYPPSRETGRSAAGPALRPLVALRLCDRGRQAGSGPWAIRWRSPATAVSKPSWSITRAAKLETAARHG